MEFEDKKKTILSYEGRLQRQWEVNAYNDLGFLCNGYTIEETNHGWKNETREATDIEVSMWEKFENLTPNIERFSIPDEVDLTTFQPSIVPESWSTVNIFWYYNKYNSCLYKKGHYGIEKVYQYIKEIRPV